MTSRRPRIATVSMPLVYLALLLLVSLFCLAAGASPNDTQATSPDRLPYEHHYEMMVADTSIGELSIRAFRGENGLLVTETDFTMRVPQRGGKTEEAVVFQRFVETADERPVSAEVVQGPAADPVRQRWLFEKEGMRVVNLDAEQAPLAGTEQLLPHPETAWLTPLATERRQLEALAAGSESLSYFYVDPLLGPEARRATWTRIGEERIDTALGEMEASVWERVIEGETGPATRLWIDDDARMLRTELGPPEGRVVMRLKAPPAPKPAKAEAPAPAEGAGFTPSQSRYRMLLEGEPFRDIVLRTYVDGDGNHVTETRQIPLSADEVPTSSPPRLLRALPEDPAGELPFLIAQFIETPSGAAVSSQVLSYQDGEPYGVRCLFTDEGVRLYSVDLESGETGEKRNAERGQPEPGWLTPATEESLLANAVRQDMESLTYRTFDPIEDYGAKTLRMEKVGEEVLETAGGPLATTLWKVEKERTRWPGETGDEWPDTSEELNWLDAEGRVVYLESGGFRHSYTLIRSDLGDARPTQRPFEVLPSSSSKPSARPGYESLSAEDGELLQADKSLYAVQLFGSQAGYAKMLLDRDEDGNWLSESSVLFDMRRGEVVVTSGFSLQCVEAADFRPVSCTVTSYLEANPSTRLYSFGEDGTRVYVVDSETGEAAAEPIRTLPPFEKNWVGPAGATVLFVKALRDGAEEVSYYTYEPLDDEANLSFITQKKVGEEVLETVEGPMPATRWKLPSLGEKAGAAEAVEGSRHFDWRDARGRLLRSELVEAGFQMTMELTALGSEVETAEDELPDIMALSMVRPDRPIPRPRRAEQATYRMRVPAGSLTELPQAGAQRSRRGEDGAIEISVDIGEAPEGETEAPPNAEELAAYLESSRYLDHESEAVRSLLDRASRRWRTDGETEASETDKARELRGFVHAYVTSKDLSTGFASASSTALSQVGDCTEHAVLLAALLRAEGIPARVVTGLIFVPSFLGESNIFGYHMWTQALLPVAGESEADGAPRRAWVDLDATLLRDFDAAHIALSASPLNDSSDMVSGSTYLITAFGELEIEVVSASTDR